MPLTILQSINVSGGGSPEPEYAINGFSDVQTVTTTSANLNLAPGNIQSRTGLILYNSSATSKVWVRLGTDAVTPSNYSFVIPPQSYWECPSPVMGEPNIKVIGETSGIQLMVTELFKNFYGE